MPSPALTAIARISCGGWRIATRPRGRVDAELLEPPINMLRLAVHPGGVPKSTSRRFS